MSTPLHALLKADPCLKEDVADDNVNSLVCLQRNQIPILQYFLEAAVDHKHVLRQAVFVKKFLSQWWHVLANREGWRVAGDLVHQEAPDNS